MSHHRTLDPQPGGFGLQTLIPLADGRLVPATEIITGTMLEGNRLVTETYRMWMREAAEFNGSVYSPVNAIQWEGTFKKIADILDTDPNHKVLGRTQMICLATNDHRIETPIGTMVDFWISDARRQMIRTLTIQNRSGDVRG